MKATIAILDKLLIPVLVILVVAGTAYLMLFDGEDHDAMAGLTPERVAENLAPIGTLRLTEPVADTQDEAITPAPESPQPTEVIEDAIETAASATQPNDAVESDSSVPPAQTVATQVPSEIETLSEAEIPAEAEMPSETEIPAEAEMPSEAQTPPEHATSATQTEAPAPDPILELKSDRNGMHGIYHMTPQGILLYPNVIEAQDMPMDR